MPRLTRSATKATLGEKMNEALSVAVVGEFFERFVGAFATFHATKVAELFTTPGVALRRDGSLVPLTAVDDVLKYYQAALDGYRQGGCVSCQWSDLELTRMGDRSALAAVSWSLLRRELNLAIPDL